MARKVTGYFSYDAYILAERYGTGLEDRIKSFRQECAEESGFLPRR